MLCQEQAAAALFNLITHQPSSVRLVRALDGERQLAALVTHSPDDHPVKWTNLPSRLAQTCAVMCLYCIGEVESVVFTQLRETPGLVSALVRLSDTSFPCGKLRQHADRLLQKVASDQHAVRGKLACHSLLSALTPVQQPVVGSTAGAPSKPLSCCVCMSDEAGPATSPRDGVFLPCFHYFHTHCITDWLERGKDSCPMCKTPVLSQIQKLLVGDS